MIETKSLPQFHTKIDGRTVRGIFAVHGNVDAGGDRSHPGSFGDFLAGGRLRARFLWQHDASAPPIAAIKAIREVGREALPEAVLAFAPDATGGTEVEREYLETPRAEEVLAGLKSGAIAEMSYAYEVKRYDLEEPEGRDWPVRNIYEAELFDISDVNWGMNPATLAGKRLPLAIEGDAALAAVREWTARLKAVSDLRAKEGRILSGANRTKIEEAMDALSSARDALAELLKASDPKTTNNEGLKAWLDYQRALARLNGVNI